MDPDNSAFENLAFNPVNLQTVLLSEVVDPDENLFKESLADLDTKYLFPETLRFFLSHLNSTFKVILYLKHGSIMLNTQQAST